MNPQTLNKFTARKAFANAVKINCQEREIRQELAQGAKVTYTYEGRKYTLTTPQTTEDMRRLQKVIATTSEKTRIAITNLFRSLCGEGNTFVVDGVEYTCSRMGYINSSCKVK